MAYVYLHKKPNGQIFYVGKGTKDRAWDKHNRNQHWKNVVAKYGYDVTIFLDNISEEKAYSVEEDLIEAIGLDNLVNIAKGGKGVMTGRKFTKEHRANMSKARRKWKMSKESIRKMAESKKGSIPWNKGIPRREEAKKKMSENRDDKIRLIDTTTGVRYDSITDFCKKNNVNICTFSDHFRCRRKVNKFEHIKEI